MRGISRRSVCARVWAGLEAVHEGHLTQVCVCVCVCVCGRLEAVHEGHLDVHEHQVEDVPPRRHSLHLPPQAK